MFDIQAMSRNMVVCRPIHAGTVYDRIVDSNGRLYKVQIKSVATKPKDRNYRFNLRRNNNINYKNEEVDVFACYLHVINCWFLIPNTGATTFSASCLEFKENWNIFEKV